MQKLQDSERKPQPKDIRRQNQTLSINALVKKKQPYSRLNTGIFEEPTSYGSFLGRMKRR